MAGILKTIVVVTLGVSLGLLSTWLAVERGHGFGAVNTGVWMSWPKTGSSDADPYARAVVARTGEVPLGVAEGLSFLARTDENGDALTGRCDYSVRSPVPTGRFWTLTPLTLDGGRFSPAGERSGITSGEIVRRADGTFEILLSRGVRPGNWLPLARAEPFQLMLRVYDTQVSSTATAVDARVMPRIVRGECA